ncbi:MAG: response regulator [Bacteroidetes bacterium]|nr:response regulator [Bacteroidota bacterium]
MVLRPAKSKHPNIKIAQTAYALTGDRERALQDGCDDCISKPLRKEELLAIIQNILFNNK